MIYGHSKQGVLFVTIKGRVGVTVTLEDYVEMWGDVQW